MVLPIGGLAPPAALNSTPRQAVRLAHILRLITFLLAAAVAGECVAQYWNPALTEVLTVIVGFLALCDTDQMGQCIFCLVLVSGVNGFYDLLQLVLLFSNGSHVKDFFSVSCSKCSWQTATGHASLVAACVLQLLTFWLSWRAFKVFHQQALGLLDDLGEMDPRVTADLARPSPWAYREYDHSGSARAVGAAGAAGAGAPSPGLQVGQLQVAPQLSQAGQPPRRPFVPFAGQGQRLTLD